MKLKHFYSVKLDGDHKFGSIATSWIYEYFEIHFQSGKTETGFQTKTLTSLFDWPALSDSISDWLRAPSSWYQFENSPELLNGIALEAFLLNTFESLNLLLLWAFYLLHLYNCNFCMHLKYYKMLTVQDIGDKIENELLASPIFCHRSSLPSISIDKEFRISSRSGFSSGSIWKVFS